MNYLQKCVFYPYFIENTWLSLFSLYRKSSMSALPPPGRRLHFIASRVVTCHGGRVMLPQHVAETVAF
jgi:hypothetical protein